MWLNYSDPINCGDDDAHYDEKFLLVGGREVMVKKKSGYKGVVLRTGGGLRHRYVPRTFWPRWTGNRVFSYHLVILKSQLDDFLWLSPKRKQLHTALEVKIELQTLEWGFRPSWDERVKNLITIWRASGLHSNSVKLVWEVLKIAEAPSAHKGGV